MGKKTDTIYIENNFLFFTVFTVFRSVSFKRVPGMLEVP